MIKLIEDLINLKLKFLSICKKGWIESMRSGTTGIGYTFEKLIGKEEDQFPIPDFGTIEIKTRFRNSKYDMTLFNATPDGDYLFPMKRIYEKYGVPDIKNPNYRVFYATIGAITRSVRMKYFFKLKVDRKKQVIKIYEVDRYNNEIDTEISWSFNFLKEKLENKIKYLAVVKADTYFNIEKQYFHYYEITFYVLKSFDTFLNLIERGIIKTTFMLGYYKTGAKKGQMNNHGCAFDISESDLEKLYIKVC